ncbi:MAG: Uma2 family endonuclease [Caldilineaceae bacterium]|nr:Uma2 family endonuclease [Caldilineaceae bacterium]
MSPSTAPEDLGSKKILYEQTFRTPEYFCYDPTTLTLYGWRLENSRYMPLEADSEGRMWRRVLNASIGLWRGSYQNVERIWLRAYTEEGQLMPTEDEAEQQRAEAAEIVIARLQEELARVRGEQAKES